MTIEWSAPSCARCTVDHALREAEARVRACKAIAASKAVRSFRT